MSFAKNFVAITVSTFYEQVEMFMKEKGVDMPPVSDFMAFVEVEQTQTETKKQSKRSTAAPGRGKVAKKSSKDDSDAKNQDKKEDNDEKCSFIGSRGGKCKSNAKPECNGMCKKHFDLENSGEKKAPKKPAAKKAAAKNSKGLSSAVAKELDNEDDTKEPVSDEEPVRSRTTRRVKKLEDSKNDEESKDTKMTIEPSYISINFNRDSTSFVYDENSENKFVYKKGDYDTVYGVVRRGTAIPLSAIDVEDVKAAGKTVGKIDNDAKEKEETTTRRRREQIYKDIIKQNIIQT